MPTRIRVVAALLLGLALAPSFAPPEAASSRVFLRAIKTEADWKTYSRVIGSDRFGKYVIDLRSNEIYFFDVNVYRLHTEFVFNVIYRKPITNEALREFVKNYEADKPRFILGYVTHHLKVDEWTFSFWEGDAIRAPDVRRAYEKLLATFFMGRKLKFRPDSPMQERLLTELRDIPTVTNDKIYKLAAYQSFNNGRAIGVLRLVPPGARYEDLVFGRDEIVILQEIYPDITPVAGIMSTVFSTPLAHVNLRAKTWNIPNAGYKEAAKKYKHLAGRTVVLEVRDVDHTLREATEDEVRDWQEQKRQARAVRIPAANLAIKELRPLGKMRATDAKIYGAKAANLGEIVASRVAVNVPDGFGIPFSWYVEHVKAHGIDKEIDAMLADPRFAQPEWRKAELERIRERIRQAPLAKKRLEAAWKRVRGQLKGKGVFVRSSTNAEDLEGWSGAGLYDTVPNVKTKEALGDAIKVVWASLWNLRAVEERDLFGIDHRGCYPGVLVQIGVNATAAGVLITRNLYDPDDRTSYTINAKRGLGLRVVSGTTIPEQIIFDTANYGTKIISRSDDPTMLVFDEATGGVKEVPNDNREVILSEERAYALSMAVERIVPVFGWSSRYPLDVEWVLEGEKVWIVQARPYMAK